MQVGGHHIHSLVWGILILLLVGYGWLAQVGPGQERGSRWAGRIMSVLYGIGAALTLDEFALWLNLQDEGQMRAGAAVHLMEQSSNGTAQKSLRLQICHHRNLQRQS